MGMRERGAVKNEMNARQGEGEGGGEGLSYLGGMEALRRGDAKCRHKQAELVAYGFFTRSSVWNAQMVASK